MGEYFIRIAHKIRHRVERYIQQLADDPIIPDAEDALPN